MWQFYLRTFGQIELELVARFLTFFTFNPYVAMFETKLNEVAFKMKCM
jgi:hypothetical protein